MPDADRSLPLAGPRGQLFASLVSQQIGGSKDVDLETIRQCLETTALATPDSQSNFDTPSQQFIWSDEGLGDLWVTPELSLTDLVTSPFNGNRQWAVGPPSEEITQPFLRPSDISEWRVQALAEERYVRHAYGPRGSETYSGTWWAPPIGYVPSSFAEWPDGRPLEFHSLKMVVESKKILPLPGARVYEIDGLDAWKKLCLESPLDVTASRSSVWSRQSLNSSSTWIIPDWAELCGRYDAMHLTIAAYLELTDRALQLTDTARTQITGWGPDETFWLNSNQANLRTEE